MIALKKGNCSFMSSFWRDIWCTWKWGVVAGWCEYTAGSLVSHGSLG